MPYVIGNDGRIHRAPETKGPGSASAVPPPARPQCGVQPQGVVKARRDHDLGHFVPRDDVSATRATALLLPVEVAALLRVSLKSLEHARRRGTGPAFVRVGNGRRARVRYRLEDVNAFVADRVVRP